MPYASVGASGFLIRTATPTGEVLTGRKLPCRRIIPVARMKAGKEHRVPLSTLTLATLEAL